MRIGCEKGGIVGVLLLAYFTWGNLLDRFVWMFVHLTQKKVVGTARCLIPTLNSINRALLHCIRYRLCLLPEPGVTCSYANLWNMES